MNFDGQSFGAGTGKMPTLTPATILCCMCGVKIESNPANMCAQCLQSRVDITEGIPKQITIFWCRNCGRYQRPPWIEAPLESREMLALCLKKIRGLNKDVKLVDAAFIWTEPHSRRIKVKLTVQKEIFNSIIMQQVFVVEYIVGNMQCPDCQRSFTEHTWTSVVQVRQHRKHKRTIFFLEQLLMKHNMCANVLQIKEVTDGIDFYWNTKSQANHMLDFLRSVLPIRTNMGKKLISQDDNSNVMKYKYSHVVEIAQTSKEDLIALTPKLVQQLGGVSPLMLCHRVSNTIHLVDPITLKTAELSGERYFHENPRIVLTADQLTEYTVLDIELLDRNETLKDFNKRTAFSNKIVLAEATVARSSDLGSNDTTFIVMTHLGAILKPGDTCLGYDLLRHNITDDVVTMMRGREFPDVILVRKTFPKVKKRAERRIWKLKMLEKELPDRQLKKHEIEKQEQELEKFMQDIEEDPELRSKINLYNRYQSQEEKELALAKFKSIDDEEELPDVNIDELLDDLQSFSVDYTNNGEPIPYDENKPYGGAYLGPQHNVDQISERVARKTLNAVQRTGGFEDDDEEDFA